ncbi:ketopantoate reductase family protein [Floccifex sp.]|uniref:ketopantoate reductase family protein n=1 Tax=Floccifex sp. TaxID=2815810 RepID=UPI003F098FA8
MKVAIIGAGAIGSYFIYGFRNQCTVIAQGKRKENLEKNGIYINDIHYKLNVKTPKDAGYQDMVLICTKYTALNSVLEFLPQLIHENTIVLCLCNGVTSEEKIAQVIDSKHILHSFIKLASYRNGNHITFNDQLISDVYFGSISNNIELENRCINLFSNSLIHYHCIKDIINQMWIKYASNIANNLPQAIVQANSLMYTKSKHGYFLASVLWKEVYKIACLKEIVIPENVCIFPGSDSGNIYSTLQDIQAKKHTEVDMFLGELLKMAKEFNVCLPYSEMCYHVIKCIEEKNDNIF